MKSKYRKLHSWDITPKEAVSLQEELREKVVASREFGEVRLLAGADISSSTRSEEARAAVVVFSFPSLDVVETATVTGRVAFPYVPGLLAFREAPILTRAFASLKSEPDLVFLDGHGLAHPRRMGIACHVGLLLGRPTIGCAKSRLTGTHEEPGRSRGAFSYLRDEKTGEVIGAVVRTRDGTKPVFVSIGHMIDLESAIDFTLRCGGGYRIPEPTRQAHILLSSNKA